MFRVRSWIRWVGDYLFEVQNAPKLLLLAKYCDTRRDLVYWKFMRITRAQNVTDADHSTGIRFLEVDPAVKAKGIVLPGMSVVPAKYDDACRPAYCDRGLVMWYQGGFLDLE